MRTIKNHYFFAVVIILGLLVSGLALAKEEQLIPDTCVIQWVAWNPSSPQNKNSGTYHVNNGQLTDSYDFTNKLGVRHTGEFKGTLQGNIITGTWKRTMHKWNNTFTGCTDTRWGSEIVNVRLVFNPNGTLTSIGSVSGTHYDDYQGAGCPEHGVRQSPVNYKDEYKGTWSLGGEAEPTVAEAADLKARALLGYNRLLKEKNDCEKYLNTPEAKIDYIGEHPESPTVMKRVKQIKDNEFLTITEPGQKASLTASYRERLKELNPLIPKVKKLIDAQKYQEALSLSSH